jgi:acetyl esterase/lipase
VSGWASWFSGFATGWVISLYLIAQSVDPQKMPVRLRIMLGVPLVFIVIALVLGTASSAQASSTYTVTATTEHYGPGATQTLSLYRPSASGARPLAIFVHGGGWTGGSRGAWATAAREWATHGWVTASIDYTRTLVLNGGQQQMADVQAASASLLDRAYVNPDRAVIIGDSAGGHLAALTAARTQWFQAAILWSPAAEPANAISDGQACRDAGECTSMANLGERAKVLYGYSSTTTSPDKYLRINGAPPMWVAWSTDEWVTPSRHGGQMCAVLGARCEIHEVPGTLHGTKLRDAHPELAATDTGSAYDYAMRSIGARG